MLTCRNHLSKHTLSHTHRALSCSSIICTILCVVETAITKLSLGSLEALGDCLSSKDPRIKWFPHYNLCSYTLNRLHLSPFIHHQLKFTPQSSIPHTPLFSICVFTIYNILPFIFMAFYSLHFIFDLNRKLNLSYGCTLPAWNQSAGYNIKKCTAQWWEPFLNTDV